MATTVQFDPAIHRYTVDGREVPSVSQILRTAGLVGYDGIPEPILRRAAERGTAVHLACRYLDDDDLDPDSLDPELQPYVAAWHRFRMNTHELEITQSEQMYVGELGGLQFGMTLDRLAKFGRQKTIIDIKCTSRIERHHAVQLAGYACGLEPSGSPAKRLGLYRRLVVQLRKDATYALHDCDDPQDGEIFAAALRIAWWKMNGKG